MIIRKTTLGCVVQEFDTDKKTFVRQEFIADDIVYYDIENGAPCLPITLKKTGIKKHYLCFEMKQPDEMTPNQKRLPAGRKNKI